MTRAHTECMSFLKFQVAREMQADYAGILTSSSSQCPQRNLAGPGTGMCG